MLSVIKKMPFYSSLRTLKHNLEDIGTKGYVFMLHRVNEHNPNGIRANEDMKISAAWLESFIVKIKDRYDFIPIEEIAGRLSKKCSKKFICFTMDDGYLDNYTNALPVFSKYNVPYAIFIASDFPNKKCILWWYALEDLLQQNESLVLNDGTVVACKTMEEKNTAFDVLRSRILQFNQKEVKENFEQLFVSYKIDWQKYTEYCLSWNDIEKLNQSNLVTIGAHTTHHYNLHALENELQVKEEISEGINEMAKNLNGFEPAFFAYSYGAPSEIGEREKKLLAQMDFKCAFIGTGRGVKKHTKLNAIPRIALTENFDISVLK